MGALRLFLLAGEPSGDRLGAALMAGLKALAPEVEFHGVGGPLMQAEGLQSLFPMEDLAVMGLLEVLPRYLHLRRRLSQAAEAVARLAPDALITIDSPDFSLRLARLARAARPGLRTIHYVAPSVWAWRSGRAAKMARVVDHVLCLLPFEPPLMQAAGMTAEFVGHPVVAESLGNPAAFPGTHPLVLALPGSRRGEVRRLCPVFGAALGQVAGHHPGLRVLLPTLPAIEAEVRALTAGWPVPPRILTDADQKRDAFAAADVALAASGTVSLELAANVCPMVIAYRMNPVSFALMRAMARVDTVTLVNLVSETRAVPEFLGPAAAPGPIAAALEATLENPAAQHAAMAVTMDRIGRGATPPGLRAARSVLAVCGERSG